MGGRALGRAIGGLIDDLANLFRGPMPAPPIPIPIPIPIPVPLPTLPRTAPDSDPEPSPPPRRDPVPPPLPRRNCRDCEDCPPRKDGRSEMRTLTGTASARENGALYQQFVVPWFVRSGNQIEEWRFSGVLYDGLHPNQCHLYEAKGRYGFAYEDASAYRPVYSQFGQFIMQGMKKQYDSQYSKLTPFLYQTELHWVLHTFAAYIEMSTYINANQYAPFASATNRVYPGWSRDD
jgi:Restriction endonuclease fold toxin 5